MKRLAIVVVLLCAVLSPVCAVQYTATILPFRVASSINSSGQIVGLGPCVYDETGGAVQLSLPYRSNAGWAYDINDSGQMVGYYYSPTSGYRMAAYWSNRTTRVDLSTSSVIAECFGINSSGAMCGYYQSSPVIYSATGTHTTLAGNGTATSGVAYDINDGGQAVGYLGSQIAVWASDGSLQYSGASGKAKTINNSGLVGGTNGSPFLWTQAAGVQALTVASGYVGGEVDCINNHGIAVGSLYLRHVGDGVPATMGTAALWDADGSLTLLPTPVGYSYSTALGINEAGQIVGVAFQANGYTDMAVLWTPSVPEPSSILALVCGLGGIAFWRRRR